MFHFGFEIKGGDKMGANSYIRQAKHIISFNSWEKKKEVLLFNFVRYLTKFLFLPIAFCFKSDDTLFSWPGLNAGIVLRIRNI